MSTSGHLLCLTHQPNQRSGEVGNFSYESSLANVQNALRHREELVSAYNTLAVRLGGWIDVGSDREAMLVHFLVAHPECELRIVDEYGRSYPLTQEGPLDHIRYQITKLTLCEVDNIQFSTNPLVFENAPEATACHKCSDIMERWFRSWKWV